MTANYAIYQFNREIPSCQIQMEAISLQRAEPLNTSVIDNLLECRQQLFAKYQETPATKTQ